MQIIQHLYKQRGMALMVTLWICVLLSVIVSSFSFSSRTEMIQTRALLDRVQARYAAQAGVHMAVYQLSHRDRELVWQGDGRLYSAPFEQADLEIRIHNDSGKLNLNRVDADTLHRLLTSLNLQQPVQPLVDRILDWRDRDHDPRLEGAEDDAYRAAGYAYGAKDAPFQTLDELQQVMGIDYNLYRRLAPALTLYSSRTRPNLSVAPRAVLLSLPDVDQSFADTFIQHRQDRQADEPLLALPDGKVPPLRRGGKVYTIAVNARLNNGAWAEVTATVRLNRRQRSGHQPFTVLAWRENFFDSDPVE